MTTTDASERSWFVYVLRNPDGKIYIGQTDNLPHRVDRKSVVKGKSVDLGGRRIIKKKNVYSEALTSRSAALAREKALKSGQGRAWLKRQIGCKSASGGT